MSILISDPGMDNPILWNFGKIEMKFSKPLDPTNSEESNKNPQKPKIEHVFQPENKNKRTFLAPIFTIIIVVVAVFYGFNLKMMNVNIEKFPRKDKINSIISLGFIIVLLLAACLLFFFWIRLNVLQTLSILLFAAIPVLGIIYKTLTVVEIDL